MIYTCLSSGSTGNSHLIFQSGKIHLIDVGMSLKYIENAIKSIGLDISMLSSIIISHEHIDHVKSLGTIMRKYDIEVYISKKSFEKIEKTLGKINHDKINFIEKNKEYQIDKINYIPIEVSHDAAQTFVFLIEYQNSKVAIVTDLGYIGDEFLEHLSNIDILVIESNHDTEMLMAGKYPFNIKTRIKSKKGHLSNKECASFLKKLLRKTNIGTIILAHLSKDNNLEMLAYHETLNSLREENLNLGEDFELYIANREKTGNIFKI